MAIEPMGCKYIVHFQRPEGKPHAEKAFERFEGFKTLEEASMFIETNKLRWPYGFIVFNLWHVGVSVSEEELEPVQKKCCELVAKRKEADRNIFNLVGMLKPWIKEEQDREQELKKLEGDLTPEGKEKREKKLQEIKDRVQDYLSQLAEWLKHFTDEQIQEYHEKWCGQLGHKYFHFIEEQKGQQNGQVSEGQN